MPNSVRASLKEKLWKEAELLGWNALSPAEKARHYEIWTKAPGLGGLLTRYMDAGQVRVYIKDSLLKDFARESLADVGRPLRVLGIRANAEVDEKYVKPHGLRLEDGRLLCWGKADDWKTILMAAHERSYGIKRGPFAVVLMHSSGRFHDVASRAIVDDAAVKLGIERVVWLD